MSVSPLLCYPAKLSLRDEYCLSVSYDFLCLSFSASLQHRLSGLSAVSACLTSYRVSLSLLSCKTVSQVSACLPASLLFCYPAILSFRIEYCLSTLQCVFPSLLFCSTVLQLHVSSSLLSCYTAGVLFLLSFRVAYIFH